MVHKKLYQNSAIMLPEYPVSNQKSVSVPTLKLKCSRSDVILLTKSMRNYLRKKYTFAILHCLNCMSKKSCPIFIAYTLYANDFLDILYDNFT